MYFKFHPKYLAVPVWLYGVYAFLSGVYWVRHYRATDGTAFGEMVAQEIGLNAVIYLFGAGVLGWLIWRAFR